MTWIIDQLNQGLGAGRVNVVHDLQVKNEFQHRLFGRLNRVDYFLAEPPRVGKEERCVEAKDNQTGEGLGIGVIGTGAALIC